MNPNWVMIPLIVMLFSCGGQVRAGSGTPAAEPEVEPVASASDDGALAAAVLAPKAGTASHAPVDASVYDLGATLRDQDGKTVSLDVFRGHPVLVTMFYSGCSNACPLLESDLRRIEQRLSPAERARVRILMVSFDSARDTPEFLSRHAQERRLDTSRWKLASASDEAARELAAVLGIRYRKLDNGEYFHTSAIVVLDEQGRAQARLEGLGTDPTPAVLALR